LATAEKSTTFENYYHFDMSNNNDLIIMSANGRLMNPLQIGKTTVVLERHLAEGILLPMANAIL
jgi:L-arabinose isomerase